MTARGRSTAFLLVLPALVIAAASCTDRAARVSGWNDAVSASSGGGALPLAPVPAELPDEPGLDDYVAYAREHNPAVRAARQRWRAALQHVRQARSLPDPKLSYGNFVESVETRVGPQRWNATLSQTFPWFGKRGLRGHVARNEAAAAGQRYRAKRLETIFHLKHAYGDYYYLSRAIAVTEENVQLVTGLEEVARKQYAGGRAPHSAVIKAQIELEKLRDRLSELRDERDPAMATLNALLGREPNAPVPWPAHVPNPTAPGAEEELVEQLASGNPELRALDLAAAKASRAVSLAKKNRYPDLTLGVTYISTGEAAMPGVADSGKDPVVLMLSVNLPIWGGKNRGAEREARAQLEAALAERANRANALVAELKVALFKWRDATRKAGLYKDSLIPQAEQSLKVTQQAFTTGTAGFLDLIDAQQTLLELQLLYERALVNCAQQEATVDMLVGREAAAEPAGNHSRADDVEE